MYRKPGKRDSNERDIIEALEAHGYKVDQQEGGNGRPDLAVGVRGHNVLMEVKMPGGKLNALQRAWHKAWTGRVYVVTTPQEALQIAAAYTTTYGVKQTSGH